MANRREIVHSKPGGFNHQGVMADGVKAGGLIFFSAIRGFDKNFKMSDDPEEQARQAFQNLGDFLEGAGIGWDQVAKVNLYLKDLKHREAFQIVWAEHFPTDPPARMAIQVDDANAVPGGNAYFMMDVIAVAP